jgi:parvulin-like peptidyl-prolyl isomerase
MHFYNGPVPGDERPVGGGSHNKSKTGHEVYNFRETNTRLFGYFQPTRSSHINLKRIDSIAAAAKKLNRVLVVSVARRPEGGQVIVGWYKDAEVLRKKVQHSPGKPRGYGHYCWAKRRNCVLLPDENRSLEIPSGKGGMGQSNICYPLAANGKPKPANWIQQALQFVDDYQASDILVSPEADAETESAAAAEKALEQQQGNYRVSDIAFA